VTDGRIDELRKRLEKEPGSRLFAQLAEELRKAGQPQEAIRVARDGLQKQPAYHSARMTLARALVDAGDLKGARPEFEAVLKGAPDNILASRLLGECLEGLGDLAGAHARLKATLAMAPGDKQVQAHLDAVEARLKAPGGVTPATAPQAARAPAEPTPEQSEAEPAPIPLVAADEGFELEAAYEAPSTRIVDAPFEAAPPVPAVAPAFVAPEPETDFVDFEAEAARESTTPIEIVPRVPLMDFEATVPRTPAPAHAADAGPADLSSPTLAELYYSQGHAEKAIEVYRQIVEREPGNERAAARLAELEATRRTDAGFTEGLTGGRREAIERTITRLEGMLAAVRRG